MVSRGIKDQRVPIVSNLEGIMWAGDGLKLFFCVVVGYKTALGLVLWCCGGMAEVSRGVVLSKKVPFFQ